MKSHRGSYIDPCTCPAMSDDNQSGESPDNKPSDGGLDHDGTVFVHRCGDEDCPDFMKPLIDGVCPSEFD